MKLSILDEKRIFSAPNKYPFASEIFFMLKDISMWLSYILFGAIVVDLLIFLLGLVYSQKSVKFDHNVLK